MNRDRGDVLCILPKYDYEVTARPSVIFENGVFKMWYSRRDIRSFRNDPNNGCRARYAESKDGLNWERLDRLINLDCTASSNDWVS